MEDKKKLAVYWPILVVVFVSLVYLAFRLEKYDWDPVALAEIGTRYSEGDPDGSEGYDGQFAYYIARDLNPETVEKFLDVPAYRYQRILYPLLARVFSLTRIDWIPWTLILINLISIAFATWILIRYLIAIDIPPRYSLVFGLWAGIVVGIGTDLYEPLAFVLALSAWYARLVKRFKISYALLALALLTKEIMLAFWFASFLADISKTKTKSEWAAMLSPALIFVAWQGWLWYSFGQLGIASGGAMATPFEIFPYFGLIRIGGASIEAFILFTVIFGPTVVIPSIWGVISSGRKLLSGERSVHAWALLINCLLIVFLPHSTFREPLGLVRVSTGMVISLLWFAGHYGMMRVLNYAMFWIVLLVVIIR
jgi:hypothetical protein